MRIGVLSDSHGNSTAILKIVEKMAPLDMVVHLGDFTDDLLEVREEIALPCELVRGNNDYYNGLREGVWDWEGVTVFAAHGDRHDVDDGPEKIIEHAKKNGASVAMFGHTHRPGIEKRSGLWLINPGTLWLSEKTKSAALIEIENREVRPRLICLDRPL